MFENIRVIDRLPRVNADGISLKGVKTIYAPQGRANEYSTLAVNPVFGCIICPTDCYSPGHTFVRQKGVARAISLMANRVKFARGGVEIEGWREQFLNDGPKYALAIRRGLIPADLQALMSFHTDMLQPGFDPLFPPWIMEHLHEWGLGHSLLSKAGSPALMHLRYYRPDRDSYGATVTSVSEAYRLEFERPGATTANRIMTLKAFHDAGIFTYASDEPVRVCSEGLLALEAMIDNRCIDLAKWGPWRIDLATMGQEVYDRLKPRVPTDAEYAVATRKAWDMCRKAALPLYVKAHLQKHLTNDERNANAAIMRMPHYHRAKRLS